VSVPFYMDVHVPLAVTEGLRLRTFDVLTAQEDGTTRMADAELLDRATVLGRVMVTQDLDFVQEGERRQAASIEFPGIVYAHQNRLTVGQFVRELELIGSASEPEDMLNLVLRVPL